MTAKSKLDKVYALLGGLTRTELLDLRTTVNALLAAQDAEHKPEQVTEPTTQGVMSSAQKGYLERKKINGYGPYLYLRVWENGHLTSKYLGKASGEEP